MCHLARRILLPLTTFVALALPVPAALAACADGGVSPSDAKAVAATLCLLNQQRTQHGLKPFTENTILDKASGDFAADMVSRRFFDHVSLGGSTFLDRMKAAGWVADTNGGWTAGENIAWGSGNLATPASIVDGWMHSAGHRANILNGSFAQIGIGIASGAPQASVPGDAGTYVTDFASAPTVSTAAAKRTTTTRCASRARAASADQRPRATRRCTVKR